jgi:arylformamidase
VITPDQIDTIELGERILLKAGGTEIDDSAADLLARRSLPCVGIDGLSIGSESVHRLLLEANVWIIEGLDLHMVEPGSYDLVCLPLRIRGGDGAPARAFLRRRT